MWDTVITIVMLIVLLLVLIGFHEAGHFAVAKMCHVYCAEFSLGFGPKLFSLKRKKGETAFTVRALPLGGYVSMYGEEGDLEEDEELKIPKERSLEGVGKLKKSAILLAGVFVNFLLTFVFCYAYALCFPDYSIIRAPDFSSDLTYSNGYLSRVYEAGEDGPLPYATPVGVLSLEDEANAVFDSTSEFPFYSGIVLSQPARPDLPQVGGYLFDTNVTIGEDQYVALFSPTTVTSESYLVDSLAFYPAITLDEARSRENEYSRGNRGDLVDLLSLDDETLSKIGVEAYPDLTAGAHKLENGEEVKLHVSTLSRKSYLDEEGEEAFLLDVSTYQRHEVALKVIPSGENFVLETGDLVLKPAEVWYSFGERMENGTELWKSLWINMGAGLYALFTGNVGSLSGPIGIGATMGTLARASGWAYSFFYLGALVSLNLAIINLFPFPGLDGWQLLTTGYEAIFKRKISVKTKSIVSYVGLGLLLILAIFIMIQDIVRII